MPTIQEKIAQAKAAGYSDADIAKHLRGQADMAPKIQQAETAGYTPEQIVSHLSGGAAEKPPAQTAPSTPKSMGAIDAAMAVGRGELGMREAADAYRNEKMTQYKDQAGGYIRGAGSIGQTLLSGLEAAALMRNGISTKGVMDRGRERRADMDDALRELGANPDSWNFKGTKLLSEVGGTAGIGGVLANTMRAASTAPRIQALANATASGGFRTGATAAELSTLGGRAADVGTRMTGGAITGGATSAAINPEHGGTGAVIGAFLPPVLQGAGKVAGWGGKVLNSLVAPYTKVGQERIAGGIANKFADGGPTSVNAAEYVPGSVPTLAEATGNAGIASLQRSARAMNPNATNRFVEREAANAEALTSKFDEVAGDAGKLDFFKSMRSKAAGDLYGDALKADVSANMTPFIKGQITQLLKRPSINEARKTAQKWAIERGEKPSFDGNMAGLHDIKMAIDDNISVAVRAGKGGEAKALEATKAKLLDVMEKLNPQYGQARVTYSEMSKPINQMEVLQGLKVADAKGNITLSKIQGAIDTLEKKMAGSGADPAKSVTHDQMATLQAIRDDLLRKGNTALGKAAGSDTFQNIATDNIISTVLPGKVGEWVGGKSGTFLGQIGHLMYSKPNEAIRNRLVDMMLDPQAGQAAMAAARGPVLQGQAATRIRDLSNQAAPVLYRGAPVLESNR